MYYEGTRESRSPSLGRTTSGSGAFFSLRIASNSLLDVTPDSTSNVWNPQRTPSSMSVLHLKHYKYWFMEQNNGK